MQQEFSPDDVQIPGSDLNLRDAEVVIDVFRRAARANLEAPRRQGASVHLPARGRLLMSGDLHDNGPNLLKLLKKASLAASPDHHLVLHEIVHGPHLVNGMDLSIQTLARVAALKLDYPEQVHILQANHDLAQFCGVGILKASVNVVDAFDAGVDFIYAEQADAVREAMFEFIKSYLLCVRCENGVFCSHSLPSPHHLAKFDRAVVDRVPTEQDLRQGGSGYRMVWGRNHTQALADDLGETWGCELFLMGHQPAEMGFEREGETMLILASDHNHGVALPVDLSKKTTIDRLVQRIIPLASVAL